MADADATELQGDGKALGGNYPEGEKEQEEEEARRRPSLLLFFSSKTITGWIRAERVRGQAERMDGSLMQNQGAHETFHSFKKQFGSKTRLDEAIPPKTRPDDVEADF